jgi:CO/xanthine dehydrogenase FAD-binding subunit
MKFLRPPDIESAVAALVNEADARVIAGGATLTAMINADLVRPSVLVSLDGIPELRGITEAADGSLRIGAMTRHRETATDARLTGTLAMVAEAAAVIANPVVRNMGTMGGAIAFADPGADYPAALVAADAKIEVIGAAGARRIPAAEFFVDWYTTALDQGELVAAILLPAPAKGRSAYQKVARTSGDFAIASCAACVEADGAVRVAIGACGPTPIRDPEAEAALAGHLSEERAVAAFAARLVARADPMDDVRGSAEYRLKLIPRIVRATLRDLCTEQEQAA